jgi:prevent-host-death family protein
MAVLQTDQLATSLIGMEETIGAFEAKTRFSELLARVAKGDSFTVTKHGVPVASLGPVGVAARREDAKRAMREIAEASRHMRLDGLRIRDLINEGRKR